MQDKDKGIIHETRSLYHHLVGEVQRQAQRDRQAARRRPTAAKALFAACFVAGAFAVVTLVYGVITFPEAPIRQTASGYVSKRGRPLTREDYEQFKLWEKLVLVSFGAAFVTGFSAVAVEKLMARGAK